jgi:hypothetical protein
MKVYQNGDVCEIDKSGEPLLQIPLQYCAMSIIGNDVRIFNQLDDTIQRTDDVAHIENQAGTKIGNIYEVVKYLNGFIKSGFTNANLDDIIGGGGVTDGSNVGGGAEVFKQRTNGDLEFRTILSNDLEVTQNTDDITIDADANMISNQPAVVPTIGMETIVNDSGTLKRVDVSSFLGGGAEIFVDNSFVSTFDLSGQTSAFGTDINSYNGFASMSPFFVNADIVISRIAIEQRNSSSVGLTAKIGIFEYVSNGGAYTPPYRFTKVYQMPTDVNAGITGVQIFTLSPTVTLTGGKVYGVIVVHDTPTLAAGSPDKPTYFGARQLSLNNIIGRNPGSVTTLGRTLETTTNATITAGSIASTIDFTTIGQGNFSANPYIYLDIENA